MKIIFIILMLMGCVKTQSKVNEESKKNLENCTNLIQISAINTPKRNFTQTESEYNKAVLD